jgi:RNA polymerase sigma factor (sigma-70 family)
MPNPAWRKVFQQLRKSALLSDGAGFSDAQLLDCFLSDGDENAFAALVRRHGPMVFGVCRRLLPSWQDAEDAFQATFLVLARKAAAIQPRSQVGNWLYGVAYRTALEARTMLAKRRGKERPLQDVAQPESPDESWRELQPIFDSELNRLPDKYRIVIVCCDLQGKTRREAACQLGWPEGTVAARLARGRNLLRARLLRRGLTLGVGSLISLLDHKGASACVSKALEVCTIKAATVCAAGTSITAGLVSAPVAILTQGVLKSMFYTKLKFAAGLLIALGVLGFGTGVGMYAGGAQPTDAAPSIATERPQVDLAEGVKPHLQIPEVDQTKTVQELEKQRTANVEEDRRESKKKVEKKKRHHEDDEDDDDDDDREAKKIGKKKREHEDEDAPLLLAGMPLT